MWLTVWFHCAALNQWTKFQRVTSPSLISHSLPWGLSRQDSSLPPSWDFSEKPCGELRVGRKSRQMSGLWLVLRFQIPAGAIKEPDPTLRTPKTRDEWKLKLRNSPVLIGGRRLTSTQAPCQQCRLLLGVLLCTSTSSLIHNVLHTITNNKTCKERGKCDSYSKRLKKNTNRNRPAENPGVEISWQRL